MTVRSLSKESTDTLRPLPSGSRVAGFTIMEQTASDQAFARGPKGERLLLAFGEESALVLEADAIERTRGPIAVPRVFGLQKDTPLGAILAIERLARSACTFLSIADMLTPERTIELIDAVVEGIAEWENAGINWAPTLDELWVCEGRPSVARMRNAAPLAREAETGGALASRIDVGNLVDEFGDAFGYVGNLLPTAFLSALRKHRGGAKRVCTVDSMRAELRHAEANIEIPKDDYPQLSTLSDRGLARERNEDAVSVGGSSEWSVMVVCDGISASYRSDVAARIGATSVCGRLVSRINEWSSDGETKVRGGAQRLHRREYSLPPDAEWVMREAIRDAHGAICDEHRSFGGDPLGTTIVAAMVSKRRAVIGWAGDSRAYFLGIPKPGRERAVRRSDRSLAVTTGPKKVSEVSSLLTRDHSWLNDVIETGEQSLGEAMASPNAHALTRCLGPIDGGDRDAHAEPEILWTDLPSPGWLILCTDGLWNYFPTVSALEEVLAFAPRNTTAAAIARLLVNAAVSCGGHDNVSVAVLRIL
ncbi:MAG: hypothetical protein NVSMB1_24720 [Polyangiales bacterium]